MKYKYTTIIDMAWKGKIWFSGMPRLLSEEEAITSKWIKPYYPSRIRLVNDQTLKEYAAAHQLHPSICEYENA